MIIGKPSNVNVNSLTSTDKEKVKGAVKELSDSHTRIDSEKELQKEICEKIEDETGLSPKLLKRLAKVYYKSTFNKVEEENREFEEFYTIIMK